MRNPLKAIAVFGMLALVFLPGLRAIAAEAGPTVEETVQAYAKKMSDSGVPGMVFAMVDRNGIVVLDAYGSADLTTGREMTVHTPLRVGSISKPVTAALGLELAELGQIDLDAPADTYLDSDLSDGHGEASTVRQLLQHRGGYADAFVESHHLIPENALDLRTWVERIAGRSLAPDVVASYSSVGYTLAGAAMAEAADGDFADVAEATLFGPLDMQGASFAQQAPSDVAIGYSWDDNTFVAYPVDTPDLVPGAGLVATGDDMALFMSAVVSAESPLSEATRKALLSPAGPYPGLRAYTTGLTEWRYENRSALYHEGNGIGTVSRMTILPDEGVGIFTSVNGEALVGAGSPSPQTHFIRELHRSLVEDLYPGPFSLEPAPADTGNGQLVDPRPGVYVPSRLDTESILRLEALISQTRFESDADGVIYLEGPEGLTYAATGGTGSYRLANWWEGIEFNAGLIVVSMLLVMAGAAVVIRRSRGVVRWLAALTAGLITTFLVSLGYGLVTVDAMELFTSLPVLIRIAQLSIAGALVAATASAAVTASGARRRALSPRVTAWTVAMTLGVLAFGVWSWVWRVLPI